MKLDREETADETETQAILIGAFHNPEMAKKIVEDRQCVESGEGDEIEEKVRRAERERAQLGRVKSDPEVRRRILENSGLDEDAIRSLSEIAEDYEEKDARE